MNACHENNSHPSPLSANVAQQISAQLKTWGVPDPADEEVRETHELLLKLREDGTVLGTLSDGDNLHFAIEFLPADEDAHEIRIIHLSDGYEPLALHFGCSAEVDHVLAWRFDRREAFPEALDADRYVLAAANFADVFLKGETPALFFSAVSEPGSPRRFTVDLLGLASFAGEYRAELLVYDRNDVQVDPINVKSGTSYPIEPQIIRFEPLSYRPLTEKRRELLNRCREAHPEADDFVVSQCGWEIHGSLQRGSWVVFRCCPLTPRGGNEAGNVAAEPVPTTAKTYLVERPARRFVGPHATLHCDDGWLLEANQIKQLAERLLVEPSQDLITNPAPPADVSEALCDTLSSWLRALRRGEYNLALTASSTHRRQAIFVTLNRKLCDQRRRKTWLHRRSDTTHDADRALPIKLQPMGNESEEPWVTNEDVKVYDVLRDLDRALVAVEPNPLNRVLFHFFRMETEAGETNVAESAAGYFQCSPRTIQRKIQAIRSKLDDCGFL